MLSARICSVGLGRISAATLVATLLCGLCTQATGQAITRIEEDWELVLADPDPNSAAPQVTCVMSPVGNVDGIHATVEVNHSTLPSYEPGGVHVHIMDGEEPVAWRNGPQEGTLHHQGEVVRWTQALSISGDNLSFEVIQGNSESWGAFGGQGYLQHTLESSLEQLGGYSPDVSVDNSGIGYAANRVAKLSLKEVRYYAGPILVGRDSNERVVHELP